MDSRYTIRNRRSPDLKLDADRRPPSRFAAAELAPTAAVATVLPRPWGELGHAPVEEIARLAADHIGSQKVSPRQKRRSGTRRLLEHLAAFGGSTWQQRWLASGLDEGGNPVSGLVENEFHGYNLTHGLKALCCLRVIQPGLLAFRSNRFLQYPLVFRAAQNDPLLDAFFAEVARMPAERKHQYRALFDVACALTTQGIALADLTPEALLFYAHESRRLGVVPAGDGLSDTRYPGLMAWDVMHGMGHFPPGTPPTLRTFIYKGQRTVKEMIDLHQIAHPGVRQLLIDYVTRRKADTDYITQEGLARDLAGTFWRRIEQIAPDQQDLNLPEEVYAQWREGLRLRQDGGLRADEGAHALLPVRAFYMDVQSWALDEPERWARWAAPCPIPPADLRGFGKRRRRITERVTERIRQRQPLLPTLVTHVDDRLARISSLLDAARAIPLGDRFHHHGQDFARMNGRSDQRHHDDPFRPLVRVRDLETGAVRNLATEEENAFWDWAYVEVLRHTGIRVEELVELTHLSIRQYQRPTGEVIALLVIAPSKSDRERVIPMSAELFHVIALLVRRHTRHGPVPLLPRYDGHERTWTEPMPYLFQRQTGTVRRVTSTGTVLNAIRRQCEALGETDPAFRGLHFTPHDFRRLFATELVNSGLPIHIGAALLGHLSLQTTRGYVAVFQDDVTRHYQEFLGRRRDLRSSDEYRAATGQEMVEFEEHFDKRKIELGSCGRPYGTPCQHEHACIRCPMLHINPKMLPRLAELQDDLHARRGRAVAEGWVGEVEGIDLTLRFLNEKREQANRLTRITTRIELGMPALRSGAPS